MKIKEFGNTTKLNNFKSFLETKNANTNSLNKPSLGLSFNTPTFQTEKEIRKIIEREIEPFIYSAKNDLRLNIESFSKEISDYKHFESELRTIKEIVQENKRLVLINQEENERKINDNVFQQKKIAKQFDTVKDTIGDFTKKIKTFEKMYEEMQGKINIIDDLRQRFSIWENFNEKIHNQIEENLNEKYEGRIKTLESIQENSKNQIIEAGMKLNALTYEVSNVGKQTSDIKALNAEQMIQQKELKEKLYFTTNDNTAKIDELKKTVNSFIETSKMNYKNLSDEFNQYKTFSLSNNIQAKENKDNTSAQVHIDKIDVLNTNLLEVKIKVDKLTQLSNNLEAQIDDIHSETRENKSSFEEITDKIKLLEMELKDNEQKMQKRFSNKSDNEKDFATMNTSINQKLQDVKNESNKNITRKIDEMKTEYNEKIQELEENFEQLKVKMIHINAENTDNISNMKNANNLNNNCDTLANAVTNSDIKDLKAHVEDIHKTIISIKDENKKIKAKVDLVKQHSYEFEEKQNKSYEILEKTIEELVDLITSSQTEINDLKQYREKTTENLTKIQESFKKIKELFSKVQALEDTQNIMTEGLQEILTFNENLKQNTDERFEEFTKILKDKNIKIK